MATISAQKMQQGITDTLGEAWQLTKGVKAAIWGNSLVLFITDLLVLIIAALLLGFTFYALYGRPMARTDAIANAITLFTTSVISCFILSPVLILGVRRALTLPISTKLLVKDILSAAPHLLGILVLLGLCQVIVQRLAILPQVPTHADLIYAMLAGAIFSILIAPGLFFALQYSIVFKQHVGTALYHGFSGYYRNIGVVIGCQLLMSILLFLSAIPAGIGLIWTLPMMLVMNGILFRNMFGLQSGSVTALTTV
jgi:hypothetical protein